jgi:hypothetical protein
LLSFEIYKASFLLRPPYRLGTIGQSLARKLMKSSMHVGGGEDILTLNLSGIDWQLGSPYALTGLYCKRFAISHIPLAMIFINLLWRG